jgi:hypothetical protein
MKRLVYEESEYPFKIQRSQEGGKQRETRSLVIFGDYYLLRKDWNGWFNPHPLAVSSERGATVGAPQVRIYALGPTPSDKYWPLKGSSEYDEDVKKETWLPQHLADEVHGRVLVNGWYEELRRAEGDSMLLVEAEFLVARHQGFHSMFRAKRLVAHSKIRGFFFEYVQYQGTRAKAIKFCESWKLMDLKQAPGFEVLDAKLKDDVVIKASTEILKRTIAMFNWGMVDKLVYTVVIDKIVRFAYMIYWCPDNVFHATTEKALELQAATRCVLYNICVIIGINHYQLLLTNRVV